MNIRNLKSFVKMIINLEMSTKRLYTTGEEEMIINWILEMIIN